MHLCSSSASSVTSSTIGYHRRSESHLWRRSYEPGNSCLSAGVPTLPRQTRWPAAEPATGAAIAVAARLDTRALLVLLLRAEGKLGYH